ncbi:MAG: tryptophan synthase subunit alpha [Thermomicrobiales bacterium]
MPETTSTIAPADSAATAATEPNRLPGMFARVAAEGRTAIMPFATAGYPTMAISEQIILALVEAGADGIEIGIPFSDPIADGTAVQRTSQVSLDQGTRLTDVLDLVRRLRAQGVTVPLLLMGYLNPPRKYGIERYVADATAAGADGFIVPDLPVEESDAFHAACVAHGRSLIYMVAPTSTESRLEATAQRASGFIYCVAVTGVTGARESLSATLGAYLDRIRAHTDVPLVVGFGISKPEHVREVGQHANGAIVASALINYMDSVPDAEKPAAATRYFRYMQGNGDL